MSMINVTYSNDISKTVGVGGEIVKSASDMQKQAATIFNMEYDARKPPTISTILAMLLSAAGVLAVAFSPVKKWFQMQHCPNHN